MANGARGTGSNQHKEVVGSQPASPPPLAQLGIRPHPVPLARRRATDIPEEDFQATFAGGDRRPTTAGLMTQPTKRYPRGADGPAVAVSIGQGPLFALRILRSAERSSLATVWVLVLPPLARVMVKVPPSRSKLSQRSPTASLARNPCR